MIEVTRSVVLRPIVTRGVVYCGLMRPVAWCSAAYCYTWRGRTALVGFLPIK